MSIVLVKRSTNGAPISAAQNDANMTAIEGAVNTNTSAISTLSSTTTAALATKLNTADLVTYFEGTDGGKMQVDWARVVNVPERLDGDGLFRAYKTGAQSISSPGIVAVEFNAVTPNVGAHFTTSGGSYYTVPEDGVYTFNVSLQTASTSGSPTGINIVCSLLNNGFPIDQVTAGTSVAGTTIYKMSSIHDLTEGDLVTVSVEFDWTGSATWEVQASGFNTAFSGYRIL